MGWRRPVYPDRKPRALPALLPCTRADSKPLTGLRGNAMAAPGQHEQAVELPQQFRRAPRFIGEAGALGAAHAPLDGVLVESRKQRAFRGAQIDDVQIIFIGGAEIPGPGSENDGTGRSQLQHKFRFRGTAETSQAVKKRFHIPVRIDERLAMIGKRQGDQAPAGDPAIHTAENQSVVNFLAGGRCGVDDGCVAVGALQSSQPGNTMKGRSAGMPCEQIGPAPIPQWVQLVKVARGIPRDRRNMGRRRSKPLQ